MRKRKIAVLSIAGAFALALTACSTASPRCRSDRGHRRGTDARHHYGRRAGGPVRDGLLFGTD